MGGPPETPKVDPQVQAQREIARQDRINEIQSDVGDMTRQMALRFGRRVSTGGAAPQGTFAF